MSVGRLLAQPLIWLVRAYQLLISPLTPPSCRYYPSCSAYAVTALERFGPLKGTYLAVWRLLRCNPWSLGGVDHVPSKHPHEHPDLVSAEPNAGPTESATEPAPHPQTTAAASPPRPTGHRHA